jgi:CheY-like chemotaxis protein
MKADIDKCMASGMDGHLPKPVNPSVLQQVVDSWIAA